MNAQAQASRAIERAGGVLVRRTRHGVLYVLNGRRISVSRNIVAPLAVRQDIRRASSDIQQTTPQSRAAGEVAAD